MDWKQKGYFIDVSDTKGFWYTAKVQEIDGSSLKVQLLDYDYPPYEFSYDSRCLAQFRTHTSGSLGKQRPIKCQQSADDFLVELSKAWGDLEFGGEELRAVQFFRGTLLFSTEDFVLSKPVDADKAFRLLSLLIRIIQVWSDYVSTNQNTSIYKAIAGAWYEVLSALKLALGTDFRTSAFYDSDLVSKLLIIDEFNKIGGFHSLVNVSKSKSVPIDFFYSIPVLKVEEIGQQFDYASVLQNFIQVMVERADSIDLEEIKNFNLLLFFQHLKLMNNQIDLINREAMSGIIARICSKFILSNIFTKILEGLKYLSNEIDSNESYPEPIFSELVRINFTENMLTNDIHYEILRNSASLLGVLSKDPENFSAIVQKLIVIGNQTEELNAVKAVANKILLSLDHHKIVKINEILASTDLNQLDKVTLEIIFIFLERLEPSSYEDSILNLLLDLTQIPHFKEQTVEFAVKLLKCPEKANIRVKLFQNLLSSFEKPAVLIPISAIASQLIDAEMDSELKNQIFRSALHLIMRGGLQETEAFPILALAKSCATEENIKEINLNSLWNSLGMSFPYLFYNFIASIVQCMTDKETMKQLASFLATQDLDWSAFDCFLKIFSKVNEDKCYAQFQQIVKTAPLELEDSLLGIYLKSSNFFIKNNTLNLLVFLFTTFHFEMPIENREEIQVSFVKQLASPAAENQRVCELIYELLRPSVNASNALQVTVRMQNSDPPLELALGMNQDVRHLRLKIADHLGDYNFMLYHQNKPFWAICDRCSLTQMFPLDFYVTRQADPYFHSPLKVFRDNLEIKEKLIQALNTDDSFKIAWELLLWLYPNDNASGMGQTFGHMAYKLALIDRSANPMIDNWFIGLFEQHYEVENMSKLKFDELLLKILAKNPNSAAYSSKNSFYKALLQTSLYFLKYADYLDNPQESKNNCEAIFSITKKVLDPETQRAISTKYLTVLKDFVKKPYSKNSKHMLIFVIQFFAKFLNHEDHQTFIQSTFAEAIGNDELYRNYWVYLNYYDKIDEIYPNIAMQVHKIVAESRDYSRVKTNQALVGSLMVLLKASPHPTEFPSFLHEVLGDKRRYKSVFEMRMISPRTQKYALKLATKGIDVAQLENALITYQDDPDLQKKKKHTWRYFNYSNVKETRGKTGIKNLGNSCYINSIIQQLYNMEGVRNLIFRSASNPLVDELRRIFEQLTLSDKKYINIKSLFKIIQGYDGLPLNPLEQMDADEVLGIILNKLEGETNKSTLLDLLGGNYLIQIKCENGHISQREEEFYAVPVDVKNVTCLTDSLQGLKVGEVFEGNNKYHCETCDSKVNARKMTYLHTLPNYLIFTLKRFDFNYETMERIKISTFFEFPLEINLKDYTYAEEDCIYQLKGFIVHVGFSAQGGHYVSYVYRNQKWIILNDNATCEVDWESIKNSAFGTTNSLSAYILIYERGAVSTEEIVVPNRFKQEIEQSNFRAFQKMWMFSKTYAQFVKNLFSHNLSSQFVISYFFNVELRIVSRCHLTLSAVMKHMEIYIQQPETADFITQKILTNFKTYFMKCQIRIVRQVIISLLCRTRDPRSVLSQLIKHLASAKIGKIYYISDCLKLINWLISASPGSYSSEISYLIEYAKTTVVSLKHNKPNLLSFDSEQEYSLHWIYDLLLHAKNTLHLVELNDPSLLSEWLLNLKNNKEADTLAKLYTDSPDLVNSVYYQISGSCDFARLHLLIFFYLASLHESNHVSSVHNMWTPGSDGEFASYHVQLMTAVYILALKRPQTQAKFRDESVLKNVVLWCDYYDKLAASKTMPGLDINKLKKLMENTNAMNEGIVQFDSDNEVDLNFKKLRYYYDYKYEDVEAKDRIYPNIVLVGNSHFEVWTDLSDKRLINY